LTITLWSYNLGFFLAIVLWANGTIAFQPGVSESKAPIHRLILASQRHFSFLFPEEMNGLIDFLFVHSLFLDIRPSRNIKKFGY